MRVDVDFEANAHRLRSAAVRLHPLTVCADKLFEF